MKFSQFQLALDFDDVLLVPQQSPLKSRNDVSLSTQITPLVKLDFPVISINMDCVTGVDMAIGMSRYGGLSFYPRFQTPVNQLKSIKKVLKAKAFTIPAIGIKDSEIDRLKLLVDAGINTITIDVAHAHLESCLSFIKSIRKLRPKLEIIAGVVATYQAAFDLFTLGVKAVRVGVGPGSICTTRVVTGHGMPQITAIWEASRAARQFGGSIIADGGIRNSGDIVKALAAGAHAVTLGYLLAGSTESPGKAVIVKGKKYKSYNGSTSKTEKLKQAKLNPHDKCPTYTQNIEGIESLVPFSGPVSNTLNQLSTALRSGLSYSGARNIDQLHKNAQFVRVTNSITQRNQNRGVLLK